MSEPTNLAEAFRDRTEALDALGRAVVAEDESMSAYLLYLDTHRDENPYTDGHGQAWRAMDLASKARLQATRNYAAAHRTVQKFLNGDS